MTPKQARTLRNALMRGGFVLTHYDSQADHGVAATRLDLPGVGAVVLTTFDGKRTDLTWHTKKGNR